ncbi:MAG TPA: MFS transporter [Pseudogracilibacillus sp.]|nr:MFS transporter [Pseudogracilibacillus sp.]
MERSFIGSRITTIAFVTLMGAFGLNLTAGQFFAPFNSEYGWNITTLSLAVSINMITWGMFQPVMGKLIDQFGPKRIIASSVGLMGVSFLLTSTTTEIWQFFLYYGVLTAIGFAGCGSMANSVLVSRWYVKQRAPMLARSSMGMNIGQLLLLPLTGFLITTTGYRWAFIVLGLIILVIVLPLILFYVKDNPEDVGQMPDGDADSIFEAAKSASLREALQSRVFWLATLGFTSCAFSLYMVTIHLPNYAVDLGGSTGLGGQLLGIAAAASAVSMWLTGQWSQKLGKRNVLIPLYGIRALAFIWLAASTSLWQLYVFAIIYGMASMPIIPLVTGIIGDKFGKNAMGSILGFTWFVHQAFAAIGVFIGGYLRNTTGEYTTGFWLAAGYLIVGVIFTIFLNENDKVHTAAEARV